MPVTRAFFYISFRVPSKGDPFPGSLDRAPIERDAPIPEPPFNYLSEFLVNGPPNIPNILNRAPVEKGATSPEPSQGPVHEPPTKFPSGALTKSDVRPLSPPLHILPDPRKGAPLTELPQREMLPFRSPPTISQNCQSTDSPGSPTGPYGGRHPSHTFPSKSPVNELPFMFPNWVPKDREALSPESMVYSFIYICQSPQ